MLSKRPILLTTLLLLNTLAFSQMNDQVRVYYSMINEAYILEYQTGDTILAIKTFNNALHFKDSCGIQGGISFLDHLTDLELSQNNHEKVYELLKTKTYINHTHLDTSFYGNKKYDNFKSSKYYRDFVQKNEIWYKEAGCNLNWDAVSDLIALNKIDQFGRTMNTFGNGIDLSPEEKKKLFNNQIRETDSAVRGRLTDHFNKYGFCDYDNVGGKYSLPLMLIFHQFTLCHWSKDTQFYHYLDSLMIDRVNTGEFPSGLYAYVKDRSLAWYCDSSQLYGTLIQHTGDGRSYLIKPIGDVESVDERRALIGLPPLWLSALINNFDLPQGYTLSKN